MTCRQCANPLEKGVHTCERDPFNTELDYLRARVEDLERTVFLYEALNPIKVSMEWRRYREALERIAYKEVHPRYPKDLPPTPGQLERIAVEALKEPK